MPRTYVRKTERRSWNDDSLVAALHEIENGRPCYAVANAYDIPESTLRRYAKRIYDEQDKLPIHCGRFRDTFSNEQTNALVEYLTEFDKRGFGLTAVNFRKLAYEYAEQNHIKHRFNTKLKIAGKDWLLNFKEKNKLSLRTPEATAIGRLMGFNRVSVTKFFNNLKEVRERYQFPASRIYNADESGISTVPNKLPRVLTAKGSRRVNKVVCAERGKNTTVACAISATGQYVPPFFVFGRIRMREELLNGTPPGSDGRAQKNGWMCSETFISYLHHFAKHVKPTKEEPVLLIVDNHSSHISLDGINFCRENGIVMLGLPPHTSHRLQPLDVGFFGPLKTYMSQACDAYLVNNPGKSIGDKNIGQIFSQAYLKAACVGHAVKAFRSCGIEPFDPFIFTDDDFMPAETTNRDLETRNENDLEQVETIEIVGEMDEKNDDDEDDRPIICLRRELLLKTPPPLPTTIKKSTLTPPRPEKRQDKEGSPVPGCSYVVSPYDITPLPKADRSNKQNKRKITSSVLTSSPFKEQLEQKLRDSENKVAKKRKPQVPKELSRKQRSGHRKNSNTKCPGCDELYVDPPTEDWIQCALCTNWWHEACTDYSGRGVFKCDLC